MRHSLIVHGIGGALIALACIVAGAPLTVALMASMLAGIAVEGVQWAWPRFGHADFMDVIYTGAGGALAVLYAFVVI